MRQKHINVTHFINAFATDAYVFATREPPITNLLLTKRVV